MWREDMETYNPKQIATELKVSTTTLRRYEEQGLIPNVKRTKSNRRIYEAVHLQAFIAIRVLLHGYEIPAVYEVMRMVKNNHIEKALWLINEQLYQLQAEKKRVEEILLMIQKADFATYKNIKLKDWMSIGEAAEMAGVNTSAIRHWESEGLIQSERKKENGYRMFTVSELRKILVISSLRKTVYYIENMKQLLNEIDTPGYEKVERSFQLALKNLDKKLMLQFKGIAELINYINSYQEKDN
jgi:DNA-binding transcriptional MerR regulator